MHNYKRNFCAESTQISSIYPYDSAIWRECCGQNAQTGLPADMLEFLTGTDEETCMAQAKKLVERVKASGFPSVKDSGETRTPGITKADILAIKNERDRLKAIRENLDLFK